MSREVRWILGAMVLVAVLAMIMVRTIPVLIYPGLPHIPFYARCLFVLLLCCLLCLYRVLRGPTAPDRAVAIDILGILVVGFCAILGIPTGRGWYMDIGIAWALQSFIATLALAKYIEGKGFDE